MDRRSEDQVVWAVSWSGGKDSALALDRARRAGLDVRHLLTLYDPASGRVRFHGARQDMLEAQAAALGCDLLALPAPWEQYEQVFLTGLGALRERGVGGLIFGNIHLADVRAWYETRVLGAGLRHHEPLWGEAPGDLLAEVVARGFDARLVCVDLARLPRAWLGRRLDEQSCAELRALPGVDPCGERGEYHTMVVDGPPFAHPLAVQPGAVHEESGFVLQDFMLTEALDGDASTVYDGRATVQEERGMGTDRDGVTRLLRSIERAWAAFAESYAGLPDSRLTEPGVTGEWSIKDILAHVSIWEAEALTHLPLIIAGGRPPRYVRYGGIDAFNAQMVKRRRSLPLAAVRTELEETHRRLLAFIESVPEEQLASGTRARRRLRLDTYGHYPLHAEAIRAWRERQGGAPQ